MIYKLVFQIQTELCLVLREFFHIFFDLFLLLKLSQLLSQSAPIIFFGVNLHGIHIAVIIHT
mgnify:CR=1 FL=1